MKIELLNAGEHKGLDKVNWPVVVEAVRTVYCGGSRMLCAVVGAELNRVGGDPGCIVTEHEYLFRPYGVPSCGLIVPDWLDLALVEEAAIAASAGVPIKPAFSPDQLDALLHVRAFWEMLGGDQRDAAMKRSLDALQKVAVSTLFPNGPV